MDDDNYYEQLSQLENQRNDWPEKAKTDSLLKLFRDVIGIKDPEQKSKVANLMKEELGLPMIKVRSLFHVARYAESEGFFIVADYLKGHAGDASSTSLGRNAKLLEMPYTVKKESRSLGPPKEKKSTSLFGTEKIEREGVINE